MKKQKCGIIFCGESCANCMYNAFSWCKLHEIETYAGALCNDFQKDTKKADRKIKQAELANKWNTIRGYFNEKNVEVQANLGEILNRMPRKRASMIRERLAANNVSEDIMISCGWWGIQEVNKAGVSSPINRLEKVIGYSELSAFRKTYIEYLYEEVSPLIEE